MDNQKIRKTLRMPITNVYAKGGFSVTVSLGSNSELAKLILDTGSSTLVVAHEAYQAFSDQSMVPTSFAQCVRYGMGGWFGPVVKTELDLFSDEGNMQLKQAHVSIAKASKKDCFAEVGSWFSHQVTREAPCKQR